MITVVVKWAAMFYEKKTFGFTTLSTTYVHRVHSGDILPAYKLDILTHAYRLRSYRVGQI